MAFSLVDHQLFSSWSISTILVGVIFSYLAAWSLVYIYRITLHPLSHIPGPKLAGMSFWYECYYDAYPNVGQYLWQINRLHAKYGPIIRTSPIHVHIDDPAFYEEIYTGINRPRWKDEWFQHSSDKNVPFNNCMFSTEDPKLHRQRREPVSNFFSKKNIRKLEGLLYEKIRCLMDRVHGEYENKTVLNLSDANSALTLDVISAYCFGHGMKQLDHPQYGKNMRETLVQGAQTNPLARQFPLVMNFLMGLPPKWTEWLNPNMAPASRIWEKVFSIIQTVVAGKESKHVGKTGHPTIFHHLVDSDLPESEKTAHRLMGEAMVFIGAGTETTARTLTTACFYIISNPDIHRKLVRELREAIPAPTTEVPLDKLEQLPYLTACIHEGIRMGHGVVSRLPRIAPDEDLNYNGYVIPRGYPVMQSAYNMNTNKDIWPEPGKFRPQRWLDDPKLTHRLVTFGRGSRSCLGLNLAYAELYLAIAYFFRRFDFELFETNEERDIKIDIDAFVGLPKRESKGVRVTVVREHED